MKKFVASALLLGACFLFASPEGVSGGKKKVEPKCPVKGIACKKSISADHNGGKVYFCCPGCCAAFKATKNGGKFAAKANLQLYITGQAKLVKCPVAGRDLNPATKITVGGMPICFCCGMCKAKAVALKGAAQIEFLYNNKAFAKGFKVGKTAAE